LDLWVAARVVTYRTVEWAIDSSASYKNPRMDGKILGWEIVVPYLVTIFHGCLMPG